MTTVYITETTLVDHPEYQVLCGKPTLSQLSSINSIKQLIEDELSDLGEGTISGVHVEQLSPNQVRITHPNCLGVWWITSHQL